MAYITLGDEDFDIRPKVGSDLLDEMRFGDLQAQVTEEVRKAERAERRAKNTGGEFVYDLSKLNQLSAQLLANLWGRIRSSFVLDGDADADDTAPTEAELVAAIRREYGKFGDDELGSLLDTLSETAAAEIEEVTGIPLERSASSQRTPATQKSVRPLKATSAKKAAPKARPPRT